MTFYSNYKLTLNLLFYKLISLHSTNNFGEYKLIARCAFTEKKPSRGDLNIPPTSKPQDLVH